MTYPTPATAPMSAVSSVPADLVRRWLGRGLSPRTEQRYRMSIRMWERWCAEHGVDPMLADPDDLEQWSGSMLDHGTAPSTRRSALLTVRAFYRWAVAAGWLPADPSFLLRIPARQVVSEGTWATRDQCARMLDFAERDPDPRGAALIGLILLSGLRPGEPLAADVTDLGVHGDGDDMVETITVTRKTVGGVRRRQRVAMPPRAADAVHRMLGKRDTGPLFLTVTGHRMSSDDATRIIARTARQAGIGERITAHSLRRSFCTLAVDAGVGELEIMASGGWTGAEMLRYYDMRRDAVERHAGMVIEALLDDAG